MQEIYGGVGFLDPDAERRNRLTPGQRTYCIVERCVVRPVATPKRFFGLFSRPTEPEPEWKPIAVIVFDEYGRRCDWAITGLPLGFADLDRILEDVGFPKPPLDSDTALRVYVGKVLERITDYGVLSMFLEYPPQLPFTGSIQLRLTDPQPVPDGWQNPLVGA